MLDGAFTRGTTPTHIFRLPSAINMSELMDFTVTYRQKKNIVLIKRKADMANLFDIDTDHNIVIELSQAETLSFDPRINKVEVQIKGISTGNDVFIIGEYKLRLDDCFDPEEFDLND